MKVLDKIALAIFSIFILIISVVYITLFLDITSVKVVSEGIDFMLTSEPSRTVFMVIACICFILSLKCILVNSDEKSPIEIKTDGGVLEIMPQTIENIALIVTKNYVSICNATTRMITKKDGIIMCITCNVLPNTNIVELEKELKNKIKEKIEVQTSANVIEVRTKVKDIKVEKNKEEEQ